MAEREFVEYVLRLVRRGKRFASISHLADVAGMRVSTLSNVLKTGKADPATYMVIADAIGMRRVAMALMVGWLAYDDLEEYCGKAITRLSPKEEELLAIHRQMSDEDQGRIYDISRRLVGHPDPEVRSQSRGDAGQGPGWRSESPPSHQLGVSPGLDEGQG